jgi:hypothetical protein
VIALALVLLLAAPNEAAARAEKHFAAGEYEAAIAALEEAYAIEPDRAFIFAQGSAYQALDRCSEAIERYEAFLATEPSRDETIKANDRIASCRTKEPPPSEPAPDVAAEPTNAPTSAPPSSVATKPASDTTASVDSRPWHRDPAGATLLGVGLASLVGGTVLTVVGARSRLAAGDEMDEGAFRSKLRTSNTMQGVGIGLAVTGGALVIGSIVRYAIVARPRRARSR